MAQRIRLDGVTHNVFSDERRRRSARPWSLELLPLLIEPADWAPIEAGVVQRARAAAARCWPTCHGPQRAAARRPAAAGAAAAPPGLAAADASACEPAGGLRLFIVAFDLARGADGRWWLVAQRTQGPSGLGYVLHNRLVISRQFPDAFRDLRVQHIASSYRRLLDTLEQAARGALAGGDAPPRVVLLTPGPYSETYFEHAYLARYLGLPLVEGGDLTVRDERLFLKTVEGLEPVHGVLRRLDDDWCDPLELRSDSALGVPGLLQAARAGSVVMANALGSAFLESPAHAGFPAGHRARGCSARTLLLPSLPTWWCGEAAAWRDVQRAARRQDRAQHLPGTPAARRRCGAAELPRRSTTTPTPGRCRARLRFSRAPIWGGGVAGAAPGDGARLRDRRRRRPAGTCCPAA